MLVALLVWLRWTAALAGSRKRDAVGLKTSSEVACCIDGCVKGLVEVGITGDSVGHVFVEEI